MSTPLKSIPQLPVKLGSKAYVEDNPKYFRWMHEQAPVCRAKFGFVPGVLLAGYDDCVAALKDPRLVRDRRKAGASSRMPVPLPRATMLAAFSMIDDDGAEHRRLRTLVHRAFTPRALAQLDERIESLTHELLDDMAAQGQVDLIPSYSLPIPVTVTREMLGVNADEMPHFIRAMRAFSREFSLWSMASLLFIDLPRTGHLVSGIIERKRSMPGDDMLSALVEAEEAGDRLSKDELVSMTYLLIIGGYETTVHLITNAVLTLLRHPEQLAELRASFGGGGSDGSDGELLELCIEEVLRYAGPVQGTKILFASEDLVIRDVAIPRGTAVFVCTAAANRDPAIFERPDTFDIHRARHKHLGLGHGPHFCLGAALARMETKIALRNLLTRFPELRLAVPESELEVVPTPLWYRHRALPVELGSS